MRNNNEIDYKIYGEELQFVEAELDLQYSPQFGKRREKGGVFGELGGLFGG